MPAASFLDLGERLTAALIGGDFAAYRALFRTPVVVAPRDAAAFVLTDEAELEHDFRLYHVALSTEGVTDIVRRVRAVSQPQPDRMVIDCEMNILRRAERVVPPFEARFGLTHEQGAWRIDRIESAPGHIRWSLGEGPLHEI